MFQIYDLMKAYINAFLCWVCAENSNQVPVNETLTQKAQMTGGLESLIKSCHLFVITFSCSHMLHFLLTKW